MESLKKVINEMVPGLSVSQQNLLKYFRQHPDLQELFNSNEINEKEVVTSFSMLHQYLEEKKNCEQCTSLDACSNLLKGHYTVVYHENKGFNSHLRKCNRLKQKEGETARRRLFNSLYIPHDIVQASFKDIKQNPERKEALTGVLKFIANYSSENKQRGIYLYGPLGVGKSHIMAAVANKLAEKNISTLMVYVPDFFREMKNSIQDNTLNEKMDALKKVEVLILDDIGAETISQWERDEILGAILQGRMISGLPTLYTSNLNYDDLEAHLSYSNKGGEEGLKAKRLMERIRHYTYPIFIDGPNRRMSE